jgi:hypothetical protein
MGEDLVGLRVGTGLFRGYNPFDLYGSAERGRGKPLPPHLVFSELDEGEPDDACAFLNAYGPLVGLNSFYTLKSDKLNLWKSLKSKSPDPQEYFRMKLGNAPLLPDYPPPEEQFYTYPLNDFWKAQSDFELAVRLHVALDSGSGQSQKIQGILRQKKVIWDLKGANVERQYIDRARILVIDTMNSHLSRMQPRVAQLPSRSSSALTGVWGCYSLLEAMYLMLFLDIAGRMGRIMECEKCGLPFYTTLDKGKYCSSVCENRARALRAYHKKKGG